MKSGHTLLCLAFSAACHVAVASSAGLLDPAAPDKQAIELAWVEPASAVFAESAAIKKNRRHAPVVKKAAAKTASTSAPTQPATSSKSSAPKSASVKKGSTQSTRKALDPEVLRQSRELLNDPKKGKIFVGYFGQVKQKIQKTVLEKYGKDTAGEGDVAIVFVLRADGRLEDVLVKDKDSNAGFLTKEFAVDCIKASGPFEAFPSGLDLPRLSFNLNLQLE